MSYLSYLSVRPFDSWTQHCLTIGQLDTALSDHWTVGHSSVQPLDSGHSTVWPLDSWTQQCWIIGQSETALSDHWTVGYSNARPLDNWTKHCLTIGQLDTALSNYLTVETALSDHWTVGQSTVRPLDKKTDFAYSTNPNCPMGANLSDIIYTHYTHFLHPCLGHSGTFGYTLGHLETLRDTLGDTLGVTLGLSGTLWQIFLDTLGDNLGLWNVEMWIIAGGERVWIIFWFDKNIKNQATKCG